MNAPGRTRRPPAERPLRTPTAHGREKPFRSASLRDTGLVATVVQHEGRWLALLSGDIAGLAAAIQAMIARGG